MHNVRRGIGIRTLGTLLVASLAAGCALPERTAPLDAPSVVSLKARVKANKAMPLPFAVAVALPRLTPAPTFASDESDGDEAALPDGAAITLLTPDGRPIAPDDGGGDTATSTESDPDLRGVIRPRPADGTAAKAPAAGAELEEDKVTATFRLERAESQASLVQNLAALGIFDRVEPLTAIEGATSVAEQEALMLHAAKELGVHYLLIPVFHRHDAAYVGTTGWYAPSLVGMLALWWPTWLFPDESWAGITEVTWELVDVSSRRVVWSRSSESARVDAGFNDFQRGWDLAGPYGTPLFYWWEGVGVSERNLRHAAEALLPVADAEAEARLLTHLGDYLGKSDIRPQRTEAKTLALVIGTNGPAGGRQLVTATKDAISVAQALRDPKIGGLTPRAVRTLIGAEATREAILRYLKTDLDPRQLKPDDRVIIYFAGLGATDAEGQGYLVTTDTKPGAVATTAVPLQAVLDLLPRDQGATVIIDASFGGPKAASARDRTLPVKGSAPLDAGPLESASRTRRGSFLLLASAAGLPALEYPPEGHGLMTLVALAGLRSGDDDGDGRVSLDELVTRLKERVPPAASVLGQVQEPVLFTRDRRDAKLRILTGLRRPRAPSR